MQDSRPSLVIDLDSLLLPSSRVGETKFHPVGQQGSHTGAHALGLVERELSTNLEKRPSTREPDVNPFFGEPPKVGLAGCSRARTGGLDDGVVA